MIKNGQKNHLHIITNGHHCVIENANFIFCISDVSRALTHQLVRHRVVSFSQQSHRYVKLNIPMYVTTPTIEGNESANKKYKLENVREGKMVAPVVFEDTGSNCDNCLE